MRLHHWAKRGLRVGVIISLLLLAATISLAAELPNQRGGLYAARRPVSLVSSSIDVHVLGLMVETTVTQRFRNDLSTPIEAVYIFPLPVDAIVTGAQLRVDGVAINANLQPRAQARASYERAVAAGQVASLLEQDRADIFTMAVTAVAPGATVDVVFSWDSVAQRGPVAGIDGWQLLIPLVVGNKQTPGVANGRPTLGTGAVPDTNRAPDASRITPLVAPAAGIATTINVSFADDVAQVTSSSHDLVIDAAGRAAKIVEAQSNRDVVLRWSQASAPRGWVEQDVDGAYAAVLVEQPPPPANWPSNTHKLAIVVDRSQRMQGTRMAQTRMLLTRLVGALPATVQSVSWIDGNGVAQWQSPAQAVSASSAWLNQVQARFDVVAALQHAQGSGADAAVFVSDGQYSNDREIVAAAKASGLAVYTVAIGSVQAHGLLRELAAATNGTARSVAATDDVAVVARLFALDVQASAGAPTVNWGSLAVTQQSPAVVPRLGVGQAMLVTGRLARAATATVQVAGQDVALQLRASSRAPVGALSKHGQVARQWARAQLQTMVPTSAAAVALAQRYGVVTLGTALVASSDVIKAPGGTAHSVAIPVDAAAGDLEWDRKVMRDEVSTVQTKAPATPTPNAPVAPATGMATGMAAGDNDAPQADAEMDDGAARPALRNVTESASNIYFRGNYGWRRTLTLAIGVSGRNSNNGSLRNAAALTTAVAANYVWPSRWTLGGELGLVGRAPSATLLIRPLLTLGHVDRNGVVTVQLGLGYQAALASATSDVVDSRAFAISAIIRSWLTSLDLRHWSLEARFDAAINGDGASATVSFGAAWHW